MKGYLRGSFSNNGSSKLKAGHRIFHAVVLPPTFASQPARESLPSLQMWDISDTHMSRLWANQHHCAATLLVRSYFRVMFPFLSWNHIAANFKQARKRTYVRAVWHRGLSRGSAGERRRRGWCPPGQNKQTNQQSRCHFSARSFSAQSPQQRAQLKVTWNIHGAAAHRDRLHSALQFRGGGAISDQVTPPRWNIYEMQGK